MHPSLGQMSYRKLEISEYLDPLPERPDVVESVTAAILSLIKKAGLHSGDRLPSEMQIVQAMNASRSSVRGALGALKAVGIIESRPGKGWYMKGNGPDDFIDPQLIPFILSGESLRDVLDARRPLECEAARLAANCSPAELEPLQDVLDEMARRVDARQDWYEPAWKFHVTLAEIGNPVLAKLLRILFGMINEVQLELFSPRVDPQEQLENHRRLLRAIAEGEEAAVREMADHIDGAVRVIDEAMAHGVRAQHGVTLDARMQKERDGGSTADG
jgi:GntR family transcriptional repressor for pyruvate dehydrogenase complex